MKIDITEKSLELKEFVAQFEMKSFIGEIGAILLHAKPNSSMKSLQGLSSPQRQLLYLVGLNITSDSSKQSESTHRLDDAGFSRIRKLLIEIEQGYLELFYPQENEQIDDQWRHNRSVTLPSFLSYYNQGLLFYEEQVIERIEEYFSHFDKEIHSKFGLHVNDFIEIYNYIDSIPNSFLNEKINTKDLEHGWNDFLSDMENRNILPEEYFEHLPSHLRNFMDFISDKGVLNRFSKKTLADKFDPQKINSFLEVLTCERSATDFLYYTENANPIYEKPIVKIDEDNFQVIEMNQIVQAIYNTLYRFCTTESVLKEKFYKKRGSKMEDKTLDVFEQFLGKQATSFKGYYTSDKHEQDLLILSDGLALIVEVKSSKRDEPLRDPNKSYELLLRNFDETIQKGYDQSYRVKSKFINDKNVAIYRDQELKDKACDLRSKSYSNVFSIIVTLERFGPIQIDLSESLEIYDDDEFPWSVCIDDLETFLLFLKKNGKKKSDLVQFLKMREKLHGRVLASDELEVCGAYVTKNLGPKSVLSDGKTYALTPDLTAIFDIAYNKGGLGFEKEKNMSIKTSGKHYPIGGY